MKVYFVLLIVLIVGCANLNSNTPIDPSVVVDDFESCIKAGNPAMESYPRQCRHGDDHYVEDVEIQDSETLKPEAIYDDKIVYGSTATDPSSFIDDCNERGGAFNDCGSPCPSDAEACAAVCAYTCEFDLEVSEVSDTCEKKIFEHPPVDLEETELLVPLGLMSGSHVTPVDHQYFQNYKEPDKRIDVISPGDGIITSMQHMNVPITDQDIGETISDYRLVIDHGCGIESIYIHIDYLSDPIAKHAPNPGQHKSVRVPVSAGEVIGQYTSNVDYNVVDQDHVNGFIVPDHYEREPFKIHIPDTFDYFTEDLVKKMTDISLRTDEPVAGQFVYDQKGKLVGNWFEEGTNGYEGNDPSRYWGTHLSFAYDLYDSDFVAISVGTFDGRSVQAGVKGNLPDPAKVDVSTGLVKYELVDYDYYHNGQPWDRQSLVRGLDAVEREQSKGTVLAQVLDDMRIKFETFPGKSKDQVNGFTSNAKIYER